MVGADVLLKQPSRKPLPQKLLGRALTHVIKITRIIIGHFMEYSQMRK